MLASQPSSIPTDGASTESEHRLYLECPMLLISALDPVPVGLDYQLEDPGLTTLEYADLFGPLHDELGFPLIDPTLLTPVNMAQPARQLPDLNFGLESGPSMMDSSTFNDSTQWHSGHGGTYPTTSGPARNNPRGPQLPNLPHMTGSYASDFPSSRTQPFNVR
jgi:hypothetical protein